MTTNPVTTTSQVITFTVRFHSTFRVGAAYPRDGVDAAYDPTDPLPGDHIKGVMRDEARRLASLLGLGETLVNETFGTAASPSPWSWGSGVAEGDWDKATLRHRVAIDSHVHAALQDHLVASTSTAANHAWFEVERVSPLAPVAEAAQSALLRLSGRSVHHLGAWRRRGLGWVGCEVQGDPTESAARAERVVQDLAILRGGHR